jgi:hypothetical protein
MRFMMMVKHAGTIQGPPPQRLMEEINKASEELVKAGRMLGSGALAPLSQSASVRLANGKVTVIDGPYAESKEVVGGYAQIEYPSKEEAIKGAVEFMELHRKYWPGWEGETEVRQLLGPEDFAAQSRSGASTGVNRAPCEESAVR